MSAVKIACVSALLVFNFAVFTGPIFAKPNNAMTGEQLQQLLSNGITLTLGGQGQGYAGTLKLTSNGKGKGSATTDSGDKISIAGVWSIKGNEFCRTWTDLNDGNEVCESWVLTSGRSVDVFNDDKKIGVNSW